ncbi:hypothetical protein GCM10009557_05550 [Virgisporangium ochraceum]|uniref:DUF2637 domain-containing protein n=1 Tax=Virgisporangium ochraceum TaxID=65505 RepID=A0A8J3ZXG6_9ACTN|nr:DUF2637 domain-containing protein [Virgisporangium ochraceum]GIJ69968.1 hypothetical protein Voc01_048850 [Virgisporangium ochraceum]
MTAEQLRRVRWGVRAALVLGVATSVAANVLHANPNPISQAIAAWPPLALLLTVELISRVPVHQRTLAVVRFAATASIAAIAAYVSYVHMVGVAARYGEQGAAPYLIPLSVDGLVIVASVCLVELAGRLRAVEQPDTAADIAPDSVAPSLPDIERTPRRKTRPTTAAAVAKLRARHPDMPTTDIARRLGVTDRTVRRHLNRPATV